MPSEDLKDLVDRGSALWAEYNVAVYALVVGLLVGFGLGKL